MTDPQFKGEPGPLPTLDEAAATSRRSPRHRLREALSDPQVAEAARAMHGIDADRGLLAMLAFGRAVARACGDTQASARLDAELGGYETSEGADVPEERKANGFASAFPVRALDLGLLDPEEIFSANNEKFSQVTLTIGQPIAELEQALGQIREGGVLALKVPASQIASRAADTSEDTEVYIYILPREIQRIVEGARTAAVDTLVSQLVEAAASDE